MGCVPAMKNTDFPIGATNAIQNIDFPIKATPTIKLDDTASTLQRFRDGVGAALRRQLVACQIRIVTRKDVVI